jgi:hypothetical protein
MMKSLFVALFVPLFPPWPRTRRLSATRMRFDAGPGVPATGRAPIVQIWHDGT